MQFPAGCVSSMLLSNFLTGFVVSQNSFYIIPIINLNRSYRNDSYPNSQYSFVFILEILGGVDHAKMVENSYSYGRKYQL